VSFHADVPDSDPAILVFARSSAKEANPADRNSWARRPIHLRRLSLTRRELCEGAERDDCTGRGGSAARAIRAALMTKKKPLVVVTRRLPELVETRMRELFDARLNLEDQPMSQADIVEAMREADVLVPTITDQINAAMIAQAGEQMRLIANFGNGVDHIDVTSALRRGITVTNTPGVLTEDTADMTMALILSTARRLVEGSHVIPEGRWTGWSPTWMLGRRISGKRLGIVGMGRIGQAVARRARAFGMSIHYHNRRRVAAQIEESLEATYWDSLDQMLARMDFVSINCPHTPGTFHLLSARRLKHLHPDAILINTARGEVVDENALIRMLEAGELANAGLDVFEHAPAVNEKLIALAKAGRVTLLPHMGSATHEGRADMGEKVIINIKTFMDGHRPPDRVLPSML
jgi:glyoxylate reductase